jgi:hypothetical protein
LQTIKTLSPEKQQKVLEFVKSLQSNSLFEKWDHISDAEAQALQNEFSQEDISFSESILHDYLSHLEQTAYSRKSSRRFPQERYYRRTNSRFNHQSYW